MTVIIIIGGGSGIVVFVVCVVVVIHSHTLCIIFLQTSFLRSLTVIIIAGGGSHGGIAVACAIFVVALFWCYCTVLEATEGAEGAFIIVIVVVVVVLLKQFLLLCVFVATSCALFFSRKLFFVLCFCVCPLTHWLRRTICATIFFIGFSRTAKISKKGSFLILQNYDFLFCFAKCFFCAIFYCIQAFLGATYLQNSCSKNHLFFAKSTMRYLLFMQFRAKTNFEKHFGTNQYTFFFCAIRLHTFAILHLCAFPLLHHQDIHQLHMQIRKKKMRTLLKEFCVVILEEKIGIC